LRPGIELAGKQVLVVGLARTGIATALFCAARGARVTATEERPESQIAETAAKLRASGVTLELGGHKAQTFIEQDLIVPSPGVPLMMPALAAARVVGIPVWSELELAWRFLRGRLVCITGSNGKTTTTSLIGHILETAGLPVQVAGNIGTPLISRVDVSSDTGFTVVEASSFQLESISTFRPDVAVLLNITPDHLDRHGHPDPILHVLIPLAGGAASTMYLIALGNSTYAAMAPLAMRLLEAVLRQDGPAANGNSVAIASPGPWPETLAAREEVSQLLRSWDDGAAQRLFSPNVAMDAPFEERRRRIALIRERIGDFGDDPGRKPEFDTPAHCRWWLAGERGTVQAQIQLNPERPPRVQSLTLAVPPAAGSALRVTLDAVVDWLNSLERDWPPSIPVADGVDAGLLARRLRMAAVWAGPCRVGAFKAGDGTASAAAELVGDHATITLTVVIDPETRILRLSDVTP